MLISQAAGFIGEKEIDLEKTFSNEALFEKTGILKVYQTDLSTKELAQNAVCALPNQKVVREANLLFLVTQSPDDYLPANAIPLADMLGMRSDLLAMDLNQGCSGFVQALCLCEKLAKSYGKILLITADRYRSKLHKGDRSTNAVFSDGACALVVQPSETQKIIYENHITDGSKRNWLFQSASNENDGFLHMSGADVWMFTRSVVVPQIKKALEEANAKNLTVKKIYIHQASKMVVDGIGKLLGINELLAKNYYKRGNTVSSSIPFLLIDEPIDLSKNECVIFAGFGVGLTSTVAILANL